MEDIQLNITKDFMKEYYDRLDEMSIIVRYAKKYINENWTKVKDWSKLSVIVKDANTLKGNLNKANGNKPLKSYIEYYNYNENTSFALNQKTKSDLMLKFLKNLDKRNKLKHNPITTLTDVVLDSIDGDLSLKINGRDHMWIYDDTVIEIANYIEKQLK